jgi:hypothetical protein
MDEPEVKIIDVFICKLRKSWLWQPRGQTISRQLGAWLCIARSQSPSG